MHGSSLVQLGPTWLRKMSWRALPSRVAIRGRILSGIVNPLDICLFPLMFSARPKCSWEYIAWVRSDPWFDTDVFQLEKRAVVPRRPFRSSSPPWHSSHPCRSASGPQLCPQAGPAPDSCCKRSWQTSGLEQPFCRALFWRFAYRCWVGLGRYHFVGVSLVFISVLAIQLAVSKPASAYFKGSQHAHYKMTWYIRQVS